MGDLAFRSMPTERFATVRVKEEGIAKRAGTESAEGRSKDKNRRKKAPEKKTAGNVIARRKIIGGAQSGHGVPCPYDGKQLLEFFGHYWELELGFGQGLDDDGFGAFRGGVARGGHFTDQKILRALQHFLFAEGEGLAAAEGNETLEDDGYFEEGPGAHPLGIFLEAMFPVVVRVKLSLFEEAKDFGGFRGTNHGAKANGFCV